MKRLLVLSIALVIFLALFGDVANAFTVVSPPESISVSAIVIGAPVTPPVPGGSHGGGYLVPTSVIFMGSTSPLATVFVLQDGQIVASVVASLEGKFTITINNNLNTGNYFFSLIAQDLNGNKSVLFTIPLFIFRNTSTTVSGLKVMPIIPIVNENEKIEKNKCKMKADLNGDCKVNLADFLILKYWKDKDSFPKRIDLNNDRQINIIDFSILAHYWTG